MSIFDGDTYSPEPIETEPPEGAAELAAQEAAVGTDTASAANPEAPVIGRTYLLDFENRTFLPAGQPIAIGGDVARRQAIEKCLRTDRGSSLVHDDTYGLENAARDIEGQAFDSEAFAEMEERVREALMAIPWVLDVEEFDAEGSPGDNVALISFRVVPDGEHEEPVDVSRYPLPIG